LFGRCVMTAYAKATLEAFHVKGASFTLDDESRRRLIAISAIPFLALVAMVAESWLTVAIGWPPITTSQALERGQEAAGGAAYILAPLSLAVLVGAGVLDLTDGERMWSLALGTGAALVALGFAATVVVMILGLGHFLASQFFVNTWAQLGFRLGIIAAGYVYCARPRRRSAS
jgi:hypothetical protein